MEKLQLIYGTGNPAKLGAMRRRLATLPLEILGLNEVRELISREKWEELQNLKEDGNTPLENAGKKARRYYQAFGRPVFSCDSGLYFDNVPRELQPGVHVRRIGGKNCTDEEMTEYYAALAGTYGDLKARYRNAICLVMGQGQEYASMDESLASEPFLITSVPHKRPCRPGFPLDRISVDIKSGKYYYDLEDSTLDRVAVEDGFEEFFREVLGY